MTMVSEARLPVRTPEESVSVLSAMKAVFSRDLKTAFRQPQDLLNPLLFFVMVVTLFPLGVSPEVSFLREAGSGILWVAALLSVLLSLDHLFRHDFDDGTLEQLVLQPQPLFLLVLAKSLAHWVLTGLPLVMLAPVLGVMVHLGELCCHSVSNAADRNTGPQLDRFHWCGIDPRTEIGRRALVPADHSAVHSGADFWHRHGNGCV